jgi:hypothetical protein
MSVRFDAASDRVTSSGSNPPDPAAGLTVAFWVRPRVDRNDFSTMIRLHGGVVPGSSTALNIATGADGLTPSIFTFGGTVTAPGPLAVDEWTYLVVTVLGTVGTIYLTDPDTEVTTSASGTVGGGATPTGLTVGGRSATDDTEWFNGGEQYLRLWSTVLSELERDAERVSMEPVREADLWADYVLATASDLTDHSGHGRDLTAGATPVDTEDDPPVNPPPSTGLAGRVTGRPVPTGSVTAAASRALAGGIT